MKLGLQEVSRSFGAVRAVAGASLEVRSGELVALLGPSGSGKTTLLRLVAGLDTVDSGVVRYDGVDTASWPIQRRRAGFVFQHYALFRNLTVFENVAFGLRALPRSQRPTEPEIRARVAQLLELVRLPLLAERYPTQLSGGQQQRIALARALAIEPRLLLLDEPFGALDAQVRKELRRWVRQLHADTRLTTLFVTHDQDEALELADRIVVMRDGMIEQVGTPDDIFDRPASRFVHQFVGESSALAVHVENGRVILDRHALDLIAPNLPEGPAWLLTRPQHLQLGAEPRGSIAASVIAVARVGARHRIEAEVLGGAGRIECEVDTRPGLARGDLVYFKPVHCRVYPRDGADGGSEALRSAPAPGARNQRSA